MKEFLETVEECKEHNCKINKKNIKTIYKPDKGIKKDISNITNKLCDCIIECNDGRIVIVEILCGTLTHKEYNDKLEQLKSCINIVKHCDSSKTIKRVILLYSKIDSKKNPSFRKKLLSTKLENHNVDFHQSKNFNGIVC